LVSAGDVPDTKITRAAISSRHHTVTLTFHAVGASTSLQCALQRPPKRGSRGPAPAPAFATCLSSKVYRHLRAGRYTFLVRAVGPGGTDASPARLAIRLH
jgi:hypothetical protein